jgi:hypothetical protein
MILFEEMLSRLWNQLILSLRKHLKTLPPAWKEFALKSSRASFSTGNNKQVAAAPISLGFCTASVASLIIENWVVGMSIF